MVLGLTILIGCAGALFIGALFAICAAFAVILAAVAVLIFVKEPVRVKLCAVTILAAAAVSLCWFAHRDTQYRRSLALEGREVAISGVVEKIEYTSAAKRRYIVRGSVKSGGEVINNVSLALYCRSTTAIYLFDEIACEASLYDGDGGYEQRLISSGELRLSGHINRLISAKPAGRRTAAMLITDIRTRISEGVRRILPDYRGELLSEITVGLSGLGAGDDVYEDFRAAGISHVLVISGAHLMIAAQSVAALLEAFGVGRRRTAALSAVFVVLYMLLAGMGTSVVRAGIMMLFATAATLLGRRSDGPTAIAFAAAVIVLTRPLSLLTASMWLSFSAALGIMLLAPKISTVAARLCGKLLPRRLALIFAGVFSSGAAAWIFVTPASILLFSEFSLYSVLVNLAVAPLLTPLIVLGLLTGLFTLIDPAFLLARLCGKLAGVLLSLLRLITRAVSALPFARVYAGERFVQVWVAASVAIFVLVLLLKPRDNARYLRLTGLLCASSLIVAVAVNAVLMRDAVKLTVSSLYNGSAVTAVYRGNAVTISQLDGVSDANLLSTRICASGNIRHSAAIFEGDGARETARLLEKTDCDAAIMDEALLEDELLREIDRGKLYRLEDGMTVEAAGGLVSARRVASGAWIIDTQYAKILYITENLDTEDIPARDTDIDILALGSGVSVTNADRLRNALTVSVGHAGAVHGETQTLGEAESVELLLSGGGTYSVTRR